MKNNRKHILVILMIFSSLASLQAQTMLSSPYTRYGLGDLQSNNKAYNMALGGISLGMRSNAFVNPENPASYTSIDTLSFIFNGGAHGQFKSLENKTIRQNSDYGSLGYLQFGFPVTKWLKGSFGMMPFSMVGYQITDERYDENVGSYAFVYNGTGGVNKVYVGQAVELGDHLSLGFNYNYVWGDMQRDRIALFPDSAFMRHTKILNTTSVGSHYFDFGLQYYTDINQDVKLSVGAKFTPQQNLSARKNQITYTYLYTSSLMEAGQDTISFAQDQEGDIVLPMALGTGFTLSKPGHWLVGMDYNWQEWDKYEYFGLSDSLVNNHQISLGAEFVPKHTSISSYFKLITYRFGARYGKTYLQLDDNSINEYGISFGVGLPFRKAKSAINLGFEYGGRGTTENNLIKESFFKVTLGVSILEHWFIQSKFD
ncbi:MAG: hypothetical protein JEZ03_11885 [Bacteroidales bacterium]|nr:hypothetical protein [Bacteroidales bacterium]